LNALPELRHARRRRLPALWPRAAAGVELLSVLRAKALATLPAANVAEFKK
jgi:hypothetical protein